MAKTKNHYFWVYIMENDENRKYGCSCPNLATVKQFSFSHLMWSISIVLFSMQCTESWFLFFISHVFWLLTLSLLHLPFPWLMSWHNNVSRGWTYLSTLPRYSIMYVLYICMFAIVGGNKQFFFFFSSNFTVFSGYFPNMDGFYDVSESTCQKSNFKKSQFSFDDDGVMSI